MSAILQIILLNFFFIIFFFSSSLPLPFFQLFFFSPISHSFLSPLNPPPKLSNLKSSTYQQPLLAGTSIIFFNPTLLLSSFPLSSPREPSELSPDSSTPCSAYHPYNIVLSPAQIRAPWISPSKSGTPSLVIASTPLFSLYLLPHPPRSPASLPSPTAPCRSLAQPSPLSTNRLLN